MDYPVETSGRILLPEHREEQLLPELREEVATRPGRLEAASFGVSLERIAAAVGVRAVRDGEWLLLVTDRDGDPRWTEQTSAFFAALGAAASAGEVRLRGEDGATWSYRYTPAGLAQEGVNGYDGSTTPPELALARAPERPAVPPAAPVEPPPLESPPLESTADEPPSEQPRTGAVPPAPADGPAAEDGPGSPAYPAAGWPPTPDPALFGDDEPPPRSPGRAFGMAALFLGGVFLILVIAMMAAGLV